MSRKKPKTDQPIPNSLHVSTPQAFRLSVIIPSVSAQIPTWIKIQERAEGVLHDLSGKQVGRPSEQMSRIRLETILKSVFSQEDPIGTEVIVVESAPTRSGKSLELGEYLKSAFSKEFSTGKLHLAQHPHATDSGSLKNYGAEIAKGVFYTFIDPAQYWGPHRLSELSSYLKNNDFVTCSHSHILPSSDWFRTYLHQNISTSSSIVIHHSLFEAVGGFSAGYHGDPLPKKVPANEEYELILKCLIQLQKKSCLNRFTTYQSSQIINQSLSSGPRFSPDASNKFPSELLSIAYLMRRIPLRYLPLLARRLGKNWRSKKVQDVEG